MSQSMGIVKCWLQTNKIIKNININEGENIFNKCPQIYFNDFNYYKKLEKKFDNESKIKLAKSHRNDSNIHVHSIELRNNLNIIFEPCNQALISMIKSRNEILLGHWIPWN